MKLSFALVAAFAIIAVASGYSSGYSSYSSGYTSAPSATPVDKVFTQKVTFAGVIGTYTSTLKAMTEEAYGKVLGIFTTNRRGTGTWTTGASVTSVASATRRAYAVTFTANVPAAQVAGATTATTALASSDALLGVDALNTAVRSRPSPSEAALDLPLPPPSFTLSSSFAPHFSGI